MQITSEPLFFRSMRQAQSTDTHALNQLGVSRNNPTSLLINTFGIHLEPECKSHQQIIHYRTAKNVQNTSDSFALFLDDFI